MNQLNLTFANLTFSSGPQPSVLWDFKALIPIGLMSMCFLVGFPGNVAVLILRPNWQQLSRLTQYLMMNLALSDLLCLVTLPVWIYAALYNWTLGIVTCKTLIFLVYCSIYSSLLTITALSVQRYMQVVHPQRCLHFKKRLLVLMWLISMVLSIPMLVVRQLTKVNQKISCAPKYSSQAQHVVVLLTECCFGISSFTITTCAYIVLNRKLKQAIFFNNPSTYKLVTTVIVIFFVLWTPYLVFNFVIVGGILSNNQKIIWFYYSGFNFFAGLTFISSSINPLLYAFASGLCQRNRNPQNQITHNNT